LEVKKMNKLITVTEHGGRPGVDARDLHGRLGVGRDFSNWIKDRIEKYELVEGKDYETCSPNLGSRIDETFSPNLAKRIGASNLDSPDLGNQTGIVPKSGDYSGENPSGIAANFGDYSRGRGNPNFKAIDYILSIEGPVWTGCRLRRTKED
jgi:hypothetical protein